MFAQQPSHRTLTVVASEHSGQARTYRLTPSPSQQVAYRRLAVAIGIGEISLPPTTALGERSRKLRARPYNS